MEIWEDKFLKREYIQVSDLAKRFNIKNHRRHPERQSQAVEASLDMLGWIDDISLSTNGDGPPDIHENPDAVYIDGEDRTKVALAKFGPDIKIPARWYRLSPAETDAAIKYKDATAAMAEIDVPVWEANELAFEFQIPEVEAFFSEEHGANEDISGVEFKEYDESVADEVEFIECPSCGHKFPK